MSYHGVFEVFDAQIGQIRAKKWKLKDLLTTPASTTTTATELAVADAVHRDVQGDNFELFSKTAPPFSFNSRTLQGSVCDDGASSIFVSSTVFPLLEGCFLPNVVDGERVYEADTAIIFSVASDTTAEVSA